MCIPLHIKPSKYDSTSGTKISAYVWQNIGGWGCGSEQAPLIVECYMSITLSCTTYQLNILTYSFIHVYLLIGLKRGMIL